MRSAAPLNSPTDPTASPNHPGPERDREARQNTLRVVVCVAFAALVFWSFNGIRFDFGHLATGIALNKHIVHQMYPHSKADWTAERQSLIELWPDISATIQMAVVGTVIGAIPAFPLSFLAARTTSLFRPLSAATKTALNIGRGIPIFLYAIIVVGFIGLGAQAGAVAIAIGSFFMLAKLYAEALETVSPGPIEAVRAAGGNPAQVFVYAMLPQAFPNFLSATLYALEIGLQASFIVGMAGAGGIGTQIQTDGEYFRWLEVGLLVTLLIVLVNLVDYASYQIRRVFA